MKPSREIGLRLQAVRKMLGLSLKALAKELGIGASALAEAEEGKRWLKPAQEKLLSFLGVNLEWIKTGKGAPLSDITVAPVPFYEDISASAGEGITSGQEVSEVVPLPAPLLKKVNPFIDFSGLFIITAKGDSMYPTIKDKDLVLLRDFKKEGIIMDNKVYLVRIDDELFIKRIKKEKNKILLISDNPDYKPIEAENPVIIGRALAVISAV